MIKTYDITNSNIKLALELIAKADKCEDIVTDECFYIIEMMNNIYTIELYNKPIDGILGVLAIYPK